MRFRSLVASACSGGLVFWAGVAQAECTMDTECKGDRVCEAGKCVDAPAAQLPPPPEPPPSLQAEAQAAPAPPHAASASSPEPPKMQRHSKGMMVGGIVMVSLAPVAFVVAGFGSLLQGLCNIDDHGSCDDNSALIYGSLVTGFALVGGGVPLIVIGAKKEPVSSATATIGPWATPSAAGLGLRLDL